MRPRHAVLLTPSIAASLPRVELRRPSPLPFNKQTAQNPVAHLSFFSTTCAMPILQVLSFDNDPSLMGGIGGCPQRFNVQTFRPSDLQTFTRCSDLSPLYSNCCALFCTFLHSQKYQLFYFQALPHSLAKTRGGGVPPDVKEQRNFVRAEQRSGGEAPCRPE